MTENLPIVHSGFSFADMERLAQSVAKSRLFGIQTVDQALVLMAISQAEGRHPALAARDTDIIQGRPAKKAEAMQRDFLAAGGKIEWKELSDTRAEATFSHPQGGSVTISWDMERALQAGIGGKDNWKKFPRQMLRARTVSEGVRTVYPAATSGMYVTEEVSEFAPREPIDVTPATPPHDPETGEVHEMVERQPFDLTVLLKQGETRAKLGREELQKWYASLDSDELKAIGNENRKKWVQIATVADNKALDGSGRDPETMPGFQESQDQVPSPATERPAVEQHDVGEHQLPPAVNNELRLPPAVNTAFGLPPLNEDEAFCNEMLTLARGFSIPTAFDNLKRELGDGRNPRGKRAKQLPEKMWWSLISQIDQIEAKLPQ